MTAHEAKVVSQWPVVQRARDKTPEELDALEREALRLYYLAVGDSKADETLPAVESAAWTMLASELLNLDEVLNK